MKQFLFVLFVAVLVLSGVRAAQGQQTQSLPEDSAAASAQATGVAAPVPAPSHPVVTDPLLLRLNVPAARLDLYRKDQWVKSYKVAIGMPRYPTPPGDFTISMIIWNPWWIPPESEWAKDAEKTPPGPSNPLGVVKMIMEDGIRIHGTNQNSSIGRAVSHACIRMYNKDARELAWEIQSRYSEKADPALLDTYQRNRRTSYYVPLFEVVPVEAVYRQVERKEDQLLLHPNLYQMEGFTEQLSEALKDHPEVVLNDALVKKLNKMRSRKTVEVTLDQIKEWTQPPQPNLSQAQTGRPGEALNPHAAQALEAKPAESRSAVLD
jgi:hypothetical protein